MSPTPRRAAPTDEPFALALAPGVRAVVEATPAVTLDEVRSTPAPARRPRSSQATVAWRLAAAAAVVVVLIGAGLAWRQRNAPPALGRVPLPIPANPTGPAAAEDTAAATGGVDGLTTMPWTAARTGADDRQLVVHFPGGGCGTWRPEVRETATTVDVAIRPVYPEGGPDCVLMGYDQAVGVELAAPLGVRAITGSSPYVDDPLFVGGEELATLTWPPGSSRALTERLQRGIHPWVWIWTQGFGPPGATPASQVTLTQERGDELAPDRAAFAQWCRDEADLRTEPARVGGVDATLVRCPDGRTVLGWMHGSDRLSVSVQPDTPGLDDAGIVTLAESVRTGG